MSRRHDSSGTESIYAPSNDAVHSGEEWAREATADPWDPAILTLDGGGIRGYSSLLILQALMHEVAKWENVLENESAVVIRDESPRPDGGRVSQIKSEHGIGSGREERRSVSSSPPALGPIGSDPKRASVQSADSVAGPFDESQLLPCHYFDYMYGTSTGGLIATMLGRLRMSVPQCLEIYRNVGQDLFGKKRSAVPLTTKYHHKPLELAVQEIVRNYCKQHRSADSCKGDDWHPWEFVIDNKAGADFDSHICQSICLTAVNNGKIDEAHLLRTYNHRYQDIPNWITPYNEGADKLRIWQTTRATSAAPFFFDSLETTIEGTKWTFKDGGIRENNPSGAAYSEFISLFGESKEPALLLSVGTGRPNEEKDGFASAWPGPLGNSRFVKKIAEKFAVLKNVLIKYTDGELKHRDMLVAAKGQHSWYKRLNVSSGLQTLPLDDWRKGEWTNPADGTTAVIAGGATLTTMEQVTREYLTREKDMNFDTYAPPKIMLTQVAEKLVRQRRARQQLCENTTSEELKRRWDTYNGKYLTGEYTPNADGPFSHETPVDSDLAS